jgi:hypothetical protein
MKMTSFSGEAADANRLLDGLENGTLKSADAFAMAEKIDPVLLHFVFKYLRTKYNAQDPSGEGVMQRMLELTKTYDNVVKKAKEGEEDPITQWFDDSYDVNDYRAKPEEMIDMLVEKIES